MDLPVASSVAAPTFTAALPGWVLPRGREPDEFSATFFASIIEIAEQSCPLCT